MGSLRGVRCVSVGLCEFLMCGICVLLMCVVCGIVCVVMWCVQRCDVVLVCVCVSTKNFYVRLSAKNSVAADAFEKDCAKGRS